MANKDLFSGSRVFCTERTALRYLEIHGKLNKNWSVKKEQGLFVLKFSPPDPRDDWTELARLLYETESGVTVTAGKRKGVNSETREGGYINVRKGLLVRTYFVGLDKRTGKPICEFVNNS
jgi:hypothetical protein